MNKIKGVNLGNWLVLEKWMNLSMFDGTSAEDEYHLPLQLSKEAYEARIKIHRSEYITERDFAYIAHLGMNSVRIPVPYFIFGDRAPFIGCIEELDKAFSWAEKYGLSILIDLHTVPLSQNGFDNGGICGVCRWSQTPDVDAYVLDVLEKLAARYGQHKALLGIQPVNEPLTEGVWELFDIENRYKAADPEMAKGNAPVSLDFLYQFYTDAYHRIRKHTDKTVVFHDGFQLGVWENFFKQGNFENVILDTHQYLMVAEGKGCKQNLESYLTYIENELAKPIAEVQKYVDVICGEWSLFNSYAVGRDTKGGQSVLNGIDCTGHAEMTQEETAHIYQTLAKAQLNAWANGVGYYYWNYKLLLDTVNDPNWFGWDSWDFGKCVSHGWFPIHDNA